MPIFILLCAGKGILACWNDTGYVLYLGECLPALRCGCDPPPVVNLLSTNLLWLLHCAQVLCVCDLLCNQWVLSILQLLQMKNASLNCYSIQTSKFFQKACNDCSVSLHVFSLYMVIHTHLSVFWLSCQAHFQFSNLWFSEMWRECNGNHALPNFVLHVGHSATNAGFPGGHFFWRGRTPPPKKNWPLPPPKKNQAKKIFLKEAHCTCIFHPPKQH